MERFLAIFKGYEIRILRLMSMPGLGELLVILLIVFLVFGAAKIPEIARSIGQGIREFKKASKESEEEKNQKK